MIARNSSSPATAAKRRWTPPISGVVALIAALAVLTATTASPSSGFAARRSGQVLPLGANPPGPTYGIVPLEGADPSFAALNARGDVVGTVITQGFPHAALWSAPT